MISTIYLAHPIDQAKPGVHASPRTLRRALAIRALLRWLHVELEKLGFTVYDPEWGWSVPAGTGAESAESALSAIAGANQAALAACDGLVAVLPAGVPTIGTVLEIERSVLSGKPVIVILEQELWDKSASVRDWAGAPGGVQFVFVDLHGDPDQGMWQVVSSSLAGSAWDALLADLQWLRRMEPASDLVRQYARGDFVFSGVCEFTVGPGGKAPTRSYEGDAGFDLYCSESMVLQPGDYLDIPTAVQVALPTGYWALITGRSSTWRKRNLLVVDGVIDNGYRGELFSAVYNTGQSAVVIDRGERLAQMILLPVWGGRLVQVEELPASERGSNGFGSTGA